ncbi:hypothetical protein B296_00014160 [Ensete ventricosum]|uniref:Ionotropic glutamate receptor C-terminal domain-containing protein n=1 Tax=Ensete ventricosum TaxID=4639 RepID=A0A427B7W1_ENSVE|nr:hypothetical protein B296_00014160 [Ensete ventricosum]
MKHVLLLILALCFSLLWSGLSRNVSAIRPPTVHIGALFSHNSTIGRVVRVAIDAAVSDVNADPSVLQGTKLVVEMQDSNSNSFSGIVQGTTTLKKRYQISYKAALQPGATRDGIMDLLVKVALMASRIIVVHVNPSIGIEVFVTARYLGMVSNGYVWIATDWLSSFLDSSTPLDKAILDTMQGVLVLRQHTVDSKLKNTLISRWSQLTKKGTTENFHLNSYDSDGVKGYCIDVFTAAIDLLPYPVPYKFIPFGNGHENPNYAMLAEMVASGVGSASQHCFSPIINVLFFFTGENTMSTLGRVVLLIWLFLVLVLQSSYTASLTSILTVQQLSSPVKCIDSLIAGNEPIGFQVGSFAENYLVEVLGISRSRLKALGTPNDYVRALELGPKKGGVAAVVDEHPYIELFLSIQCKFSIVGSEFTRNGWGFVSIFTCQVS